VNITKLSVYTCGRVMIAASRPLILFLVNNFVGQEAAAGLSIVFLANALALAAIAADPHRRFYAKYFKATTPRFGQSYAIYLASVLLFAVAGLCVSGVIAWRLSGSIGLLVAASMYFGSEKLADEVMRFQLFASAFEEWGRANIVRSVLQLTFLTVLIGIARTHVSATVIAAMMALVNLAIFLPKLPYASYNLLLHLKRSRRARLAKKALRVISADWLLWVLAMLSAGMSYVDRTLAAIVAPAILPQFMLASMSLSVIQLTVDYFYISRHRRAFLDGSITLDSVVRTREFPVILVGGLIMAVAGCLLTLRWSRNGDLLEGRYIAVMVVIQLSVALISVLREIPYWRGAIRTLVFVEMGFYALFASVVSATWRLWPNPIVVFAVAAACIVARLGAYVILCRRIDAGRPRLTTQIPSEHQLVTGDA